MKLNGIYIAKDRSRIIKENLTRVQSNLEKHLMRWNRRSLTTLGKIVLVKTFGISQIIYLMQTIYLDDKAIAQFERQLYNFLWSKEYRPDKIAPDKIKRCVVNTKIENGGYGMIDLKKLRDSICIKNLGRLKKSQHPFLTHLNQTTNWDGYLNPRSTSSDSLLVKGLELLGNLRVRQVNEDSRFLELTSVRNALGAISWKDLLKKEKENSIIVYLLQRQSKTRIRNITQSDWRQLRKVINPKYIPIFDTYDWNFRATDGDNNGLLFLTTGKKVKARTIDSLTSKDIRKELECNDPITIFRSGIILTPQECRSWGHKIKKMKSVRHRNALLRLAHGDIYTEERKFRYGLSESPHCKCGKIDTLIHKFHECEMTKEIWNEVQLGTLEPGNELKSYIGANLDVTMETLTLIAEATLTLTTGNYNKYTWQRSHERITKQFTLLDPGADEHLIPEGHGQEVMLEGTQPEAAPHQA